MIYNDEDTGIFHNPIDYTIWTKKKMLSPGILVTTIIPDHPSGFLKVMDFLNENNLDYEIHSEPIQKETPVNRWYGPDIEKKMVYKKAFKITHSNEGLDVWIKLCL